MHLNVPQAAHDGQLQVDLRAAEHRQREPGHRQPKRNGLHVLVRAQLVAAGQFFKLVTSCDQFFYLKKPAGILDQEEASQIRGRHDHQAVVRGELPPSLEVVIHLAQLGHGHLTGDFFVIDS